MRVFQVSGGGSGSGAFADYQFAEDKTISTKDLSDYTQKLRLTTKDLDTGIYRIGWSYAWNLDSTSHNFLARIQINDLITHMLHEQEPKDNSGSYASTGTDQKHRASGFFVESLSGINNIDLDWGRTGPGGIETSIWDVRLEIWRIS